MEEEKHAQPALPPAPTSFTMPVRQIFSQRDLENFHQSQTYSNILHFVRACNDATSGQTISQDCPANPVILALVDMLEHMNSWVDEIPPLQQPMRFGNRAFKTWHERLCERSPEMLIEVLGEQYRDAIVELSAYLSVAFGNETRIDYGTGHETTFVVFLYCLFRLNVLGREHLPAVVLRVFVAYVRVMRRLQEVYMLEPAGSHGVWGLDDYHCLVFVWGSSQLREHPIIRPSSIHDDGLLSEYSAEYMYLDGVRFIKKIKNSAPFAESSPMLHDISGLPDWKKVNSGMLKLYQGEVLGKLPVIQHFLFGSIVPCTWVTSGPQPHTNRSPMFPSGLAATAATMGPTVTSAGVSLPSVMTSVPWDVTRPAPGGESHTP